MVTLEGTSIILTVPPTGLTVVLITCGIFTIYATIDSLRLSK